MRSILLRPWLAAFRRFVEHGGTLPIALRIAAVRLPVLEKLSGERDTLLLPVYSRIFFSGYAIFFAPPGPLLYTPSSSVMKLGGDGTTGTRQLLNERKKPRRPRSATIARPRALAASGGCSYATRTNSDAAERQPLPRAPKVSPRQRRRIEDTHAYLCARVDPIMGSLILNLMEARPDDIRVAALNHLLSKKQAASGGAHDSNEAPAEAVASGSAAGIPEDSKLRRGFDDVGSVPGPVEGAEVAQQQRLARRQDRLFMAREIGPLITELIRRTLRCMPTDVEGFLIEQLQGCTLEDVTTQDKGGNSSRRQHPHTPSDVTGLKSPDILTGSRSNSNSSNSKQFHRPTRPSTARSRLQQAQSLDKHVQQTSPPLSGRETEARRSPSPPRIPRNGGLSDEDNSDHGVGDRGDAPPSSRGDGGDMAPENGVKESQNKPWDIEVLSCSLKRCCCNLPYSLLCDNAVDANIASMWKGRLL